MGHDSLCPASTGCVPCNMRIAIREVRQGTGRSVKNIEDTNSSVVAFCRVVALRIFLRRGVSQCTFRQTHRQLGHYSVCHLASVCNGGNGSCFSSRLGETERQIQESESGPVVHVCEGSYPWACSRDLPGLDNPVQARDSAVSVYLDLLSDAVCVRLADRQKSKVTEAQEVS